MKNIPRYLICNLCVALITLPLAAQQYFPVIDAQQKRQVITAESAQQHIVFHKLLPGQTYGLTVPGGEPCLAGCMPEISVLTPNTQVIDYNAESHLLRFVASNDTMEFRFDYPCTWDVSNPPRHYISMMNLNEKKGKLLGTSTSEPNVSPVTKVFKIKDSDFFNGNNIEFGPEGGNSISFYSIITNCNSWTASGAPAWLTVSLSENVTVSLICAQNFSNNPRTATITINGCGYVLTMFVTQSGASMVVTSGTAVSLIKDIFLGGNCLDISNVTFSGQNTQIGSFINGLNNVGFSSGVILATGDINVAPGPNDNNGAGGGGSIGIDNDLAAIATSSLFDLGVIEFDFTPTKTPFSFSYAFASEEYCEYVNTAFNDVFGFFISGPGISGTKNLAVVPSTNTPITINTINHVANSNFYIPNTPFGLDNCESGGVSGTLPPQPVSSAPATKQLQYDGFTKIMVASTPVVPCATYHLKLAIGDVGDGVWDSAVFLKAGSLDGGGKASVDWLVNGESGVDLITEGCGTVGLLIDRLSSDLSLPLTVSFSIAGTAINGIDYSAINSSYTIPAGVDQITIPVNIVNDLILEGAQTIVLTLSNACSCLHPQEILTINDYLPMVLLPDTITICGPAGAGTVGVTANDGVEPYSYQWNTGGNQSSITVFVNQNTNYTVTVTDACGKTKTAVTRINLTSAPTANFILPAPQLCPGHTVNLLVNFTGVPPYQLRYQLNGIMQPIISGIQNNPYSLIVNQPGLYQITSVIDAFGCSGTGSGAILVTTSSLALSGVTFNASGSNQSNGSINTTVAGGQGPYSYNWQGPSSIGNTPDPVNILPGIYALTVTDGFGCTKAQNFTVQTSIPWTFEITGINQTIIIPKNLVSHVQGGSLQAGDYIGAFYDLNGALKCGGYGIWLGVDSAIAFAVYGNDAASPAKNGFASGEVFKIKVWHSNQELNAAAEYAPIGTLGIVSNTNTFAPDGISMIITINAGTTKAIALNNGWNMISSNVMPTQPDMTAVFDQIASSVDIVKDGNGASFIPAIPINGIGNWDLLKGYQVKANKKDTLQIVGQNAVPQNTPIPLHTGWQIISYLRDSPQNIATVFAPIQGQISVVKNNNGQTYLPQFNINSIGNMRPCEGYKVKALMNTTLLYQPNFTSQIDDRNENTAGADITHFVLNSSLNTGNNATIILTDSVAEGFMRSGDEIGVFTAEGVLCGAAKFTQGRHLAITVWGDDTSTDTLFEGLRFGEAYNFKVWNSKAQNEHSAQVKLLSGIKTYEPDAIELITNVALQSVSELASNSFDAQILRLFPNPASESLNISIISKTPGKVALTALRLDGTLVWDLQELEYQPDGTKFNFKVPAKLPSGLYWFRFQFENRIIYRQIFFQK